MVSSHHRGIKGFSNKLWHNSKRQNNILAVLWHHNIGTILYDYHAWTIYTLCQQAIETLCNMFRGHHASRVLDSFIKHLFCIFTQLGFCHNGCVCPCRTYCFVADGTILLSGQGPGHGNHTMFWYSVGHHCWADSRGKSS